MIGLELWEFDGNHGITPEAEQSPTRHANKWAGLYIAQNSNNKISYPELIEWIYRRL